MQMTWRDFLFVQPKKFGALNAIPMTSGRPVHRSPGTQEITTPSHGLSSRQRTKATADAELAAAARRSETRRREEAENDRNALPTWHRLRTVKRGGRTRTPAGRFQDVSVAAS